MSLLQFLGVGTVASTKDTNTNEIMVYLPSLFPSGDGRVAAQVKDVERTSLNSFGEQVRSRVMKSNTIPATWKKMGDTNRITSPDVREGTPVGIYQVQGQNTYYWTLDGMNAETFRMETVVHGWSANPNLTEDTPFNVDNFYTMTVSTHTGLMQLRTAMANNEPTMFDVQINTQEGKISIGGNEKNYFILDDMRRSLTYQNADGAYFDVHRETATLLVPDTTQVFADKKLVLRTKQLYIQAEEAFVDIGTTHWKGKFEHTGDTEQLGNYAQTGMYKHTGDVDRTGNSVSTGTVIGLTDVRTMIVSLNLHTHGNVENGRGVTSPPLPS